jgi:hypothetical protein
MKERKTALIIVALLLVLSVFFYLVPIESVLNKIPFIGDFYNNTTLSINSKNGESSVTINGKEYGETPLEIVSLSSGEYTVVMSKISETDSFYEEHSFDIYLAKNTEARIDIEIGPNDMLYGIVMYYTSIPKSSDNKGMITVTSDPLDAEITLDGEYLADSPMSGYELKSGQYTIEISENGYESVDAPVIIREGYHLNVRAFLLPIPLTLETADNEQE